MRQRGGVGWAVVLGAAGWLAACGGGGAALQGAGGAGQAKARVAEAAGRLVEEGAPPAAPREGDLLVFRVAAGRDLNTFNRQPHTLVLVFYQLSQATVFGQLAETPEGRMKLLEGEAFDPSVLSRRRAVVQPGEGQSFVMDRIEGARYAAVIGGFYSAAGQGAARVVPIVPRKSGMLLWKKPAPQVVELGLGSSGFTP